MSRRVLVDEDEGVAFGVVDRGQGRAAGYVERFGHQGGAESHRAVERGTQVAHLHVEDDPGLVAAPDVPGRPRLGTAEARRHRHDRAFSDLPAEQLAVERGLTLGVTRHDLPVHNRPRPVLCRAVMRRRPVHVPYRRTIAAPPRRRSPPGRPPDGPGYDPGVDAMLGRCSLETLRQRTSMKWRTYPPDVLPAFVAEMDFDLAAPIVEAVGAALAIGDCGYGHKGRLGEAFAAFAGQRLRWPADPARGSAGPAVMPGVPEVVQAVPPPGSGVVITPPVYPPFFY